MKYQLIVSDAAVRDMTNHIAFLADVSKPAARKTKDRIMAALRSLEEMPYRFPFLEEDELPKNKYHKMYVEKWYLVLYQIRDDAVYVDYILDCRQDYQWLLRP